MSTRKSSKSSAPSKTKRVSRYGWVPDRPDVRDKLYARIAKPPLLMPPRQDLRALCSGVEDQGELGSCTANALAGNLEFLCRKAGGTAPDYSRLFVYYNERAMEGTIDQDAGAMIRDGVKSLVSLGVCLEKSWPYVTDQFKQKPTAACFKEAANHRVTSYHRILTLTEMKQCLAEGYPFVFGFSVYEGFESDQVAHTGKVNLPTRTERQLGGHAVCAVGYDDKTQRMLVRNSWGPNWGMGGYFTMPYSYIGNPNLADDFWTIRAFTNPNAALRRSKR